IDGLIHISELSWSHVNHPSEILSIGQVVPVKVLDIDRERQRISLGLKQTQEDPWQRVLDTYNLGDEIEGKVTKVVSFGAFVEILDAGAEGDIGEVRDLELSDEVFTGSEQPSSGDGGADDESGGESAGEAADQEPAADGDAAATGEAGATETGESGT